MKDKICKQSLLTQAGFVYVCLFNYLNYKNIIHEIKKNKEK